MGKCRVKVEDLEEFVKARRINKFWLISLKINKVV